MSGIIFVRDAMTRDVKTISPNSSVMEAVKKMNKFGIGSIVAVQDGRPVGIITERDISRKIVEPWLDPTVIKVMEIMSSPLITIRDDTPLEEAAKTMTDKVIKKLPVVKNGKLVGIVTATDLARTETKLIDLLKGLLWAPPK